MKRTLLILLPVLIVWAAGWYIQSSLAGTKPEKHYEPPPKEENPLLEKLKLSYLKQKNNQAARIAYIRALETVLKESGNVRSKQGAELRMLLEEQLESSPDEQWVLKSLADLAFNQMDFDSSVQNYEEYLKRVPDDDEMRGRYASALIFVNRFSEAEAELRGLLEKNAENFHANAYLAIVLSQSGSSEEALRYGEKALSLAPNEEARRRFAAFVEGLKARGESERTEPAAGTPAREIVNAVKTHPIAGPKFLRADVESGVLSLYFLDFPMSAMPDFARKKFISGLITKLPADQQGPGKDAISEIRFIDQQSGELMERVDTAGPAGD